MSIEVFNRLHTLSSDPLIQGVNDAERRVVWNADNEIAVGKPSQSPGPCVEERQSYLA